MALPKLDFGKRVGGALYIHSSGIGWLPQGWKDLIEEIYQGWWDLIKEIYTALDTVPRFNVVKLKEEGTSLLWYPKFHTDPFPALFSSTTYTGQVTCRAYGGDNPPILHRKELLMPPTASLVFRHHIGEWEKLTRDLEAAGLYDGDKKRIGRRKFWNEKLHRAGYRVQGHKLVKLRRRN